MESTKFIDMTHSLSSTTPTWSGGCGFSLRQFHDVVDGDFGFTIQEVNLHAGIGTHMDAPAHCFRGGKSIDEIPIGDLFSPIIVIDFSETNSDSKILTVGDLKKWEQKYESIGQGIFVFIHTGWGKYFGDAERYRNNLVFPSIHEDAAAYLLERGARGIGIDTLSPDLPNSGFPVHRLFLGANKFLIENVANLSLLPPVGASMVATPLKIEKATEAPLRLIGLVPTAH